ncbi:hypothetical protein ABFU27_09700 [Xanthomonas campestris pv. raphani]|uniref:hypothetical protein n=1 Tax=Xanthomonas campestris TaxID=339 RepID=UPI001E2D05EF|nr:hypothetical protein [Xanthomonas campestris]MCC8686363.1 hypothetical protein [Xanthomonas campestris]MCW2000049.1 hypothetical protein [Xanthomonas campestris]MEA0967862.1 hypothetical protein [Xanthomonas campestris pv. campestris]MEA9680610.1 hypothetical protein [Xanthomonas campestris pv. raphani]MEA9699053.1 hypothetical protein [Xanthomonas campestris pv. raphani]
MTLKNCQNSPCSTNTYWRKAVPLANDPMRFALTALITCLIAGCSLQPPPENVPIAKEQIEMRTVVPLVRSLTPHDRGPTELEFDVPALPDDATPPVFIGVRITGVDPTAVSQSADRLISTGVSAELHLERIEPSGPVSVELQRSQRVGVGQQASIPLSADGMAPGLFAFDADGTTLQDAGLSTEQTASRELAFGYSNAVQPGRYRLKLRFDQNAEALVAANAQLLVAYTYKGK